MKNKIIFVSILCVLPHSAYSMSWLLGTTKAATDLSRYDGMHETIMEAFKKFAHDDVNTQEFAQFIQHWGKDILKVKDKERNSTLLILLANNGCPNKIRFLLEKYPQSCQVDAADNNGYRALTYAANRGCSKSIAALLEHGATVYDVDIMKIWPTTESTACLDLLLGHVSQSLKDKNQKEKEEVEDMLLRVFQSFATSKNPALEKEGRDASDKTEYAEKIIEMGIDINKKVRGFTALQAAVYADNAKLAHTIMQFWTCSLETKQEAFQTIWDKKNLKKVCAYGATVMSTLGIDLNKETVFINQDKETESKTPLRQAVLADRVEVIDAMIKTRKCTRETIVQAFKDVTPAQSPMAIQYFNKDEMQCYHDPEQSKIAHFLLDKAQALKLLISEKEGE